MTLPTLDQAIALDDLPPLTDKWLFVGIDLAPNDSLETGIAVIDRDKNLVRMEKVDSDKDIFLYLSNLGPKSGLLIALDIPKNLSANSKWRQQQIRMHPLQILNNSDETASSRFARRAYDFYQRATAEGFFVINFFSHYAKMRYGLNVPYRSRSPQGCRALQAAIKEVLKLQNITTNLAPSSVLDAMVGAYTAWSIYKADQIINGATPSPVVTKRGFRQRASIFRPNKSSKPFKMPFRLFQDLDRRLYIDPLGLCPER